MQTFVALLRGVNVGGNRMLSMTALVKIIEQAGGIGVRTYVQSGNAVFRSKSGDAARMAKRLASAIASGHGFEPQVMILTTAELAAAVAGNPFREAEEQPKSVHVFFLEKPPQRPDLKALDSQRAESERFALSGQVFYLHTPDGFGTSRLAQRAEKLLGVAATARNWRTATTLLRMAQELDPD